MEDGKAGHVRGVGQRKIRGGGELYPLSTQTHKLRVDRRARKIKNLGNESLENFNRKIWMVSSLSIDSFSIMSTNLF